MSTCTLVSRCVLILFRFVVCGCARSHEQAAAEQRGADGVDVRERLAVHDAVPAVGARDRRRLAALSRVPHEALRGHRLGGPRPGAARHPLVRALRRGHHSRAARRSACPISSHFTILVCFWHLYHIQYSLLLCADICHQVLDLYSQKPTAERLEVEKIGNSPAPTRQSASSVSASVSANSSSNQHPSSSTANASSSAASVAPASSAPTPAQAVSSSQKQSHSHPPAVASSLSSAAAAASTAAAVAAATSVQATAQLVANVMPTAIAPSVTAPAAVMPSTWQAPTHLLPPNLAAVSTAHAG